MIKPNFFFVRVRNTIPIPNNQHAVTFILMDTSTAALNNLVNFGKEIMEYRR